MILWLSSIVKVIDNAPCVGSEGSFNLKVLMEFCCLHLCKWMNLISLFCQWHLWLSKHCTFRLLCLLSKSWGWALRHAFTITSTKHISHWSLNADLCSQIRYLRRSCREHEQGVEARSTAVELCASYMQFLGNCGAYSTCRTLWNHKCMLGELVQGSSLCQSKLLNR